LKGRTLIPDRDPLCVPVGGGGPAAIVFLDFDTEITDVDAIDVGSRHEEGMA